MNLSSDIVAFIKQVPPLDQLPENSLEQCAQALEISYHVRGERLGLYPQESSSGRKTPPGLFIVRAGAVALHQPDGTLLEQRGEGELFGHAIHFDGRALPYQAIASEDTLLWYIPGPALDKLEQEFPLLHDWLQAPGARLHSETPENPGKIGDLPLRSPITAAPEESVQTCAQRMSQHRVSALAILQQEQLVGILTDRDLRARIVAPGLAHDTPVEQVMSPTPVTTQTKHSVEQALLLLLRHGIHHLPVTDETGVLQGMVSAGDLLRIHSPHPLRLVRDIGRAGAALVQAGISHNSGAHSGGEVARLTRQGPSLLAHLAAELKDVSQVGRVASLITDACTRRLIELAEDELGHAPMPYAWLAFGSQARMEQGLVSDQDNGLLLAREPQGDEAEYFEQLAQRVCDGLALSGYSYCNGGVMAMGQWRMSLERWQHTFQHWIAEPEPKSVMHCSIFFDMRPIYGDMAIAEQLRRDVLQKAQANRIFLRFLAAESLTHKPPLGFFRQFVQERGGGQSQGLNLKQRGVIPVVDLARVLALEGALSPVHSEERLHAAAQAGLCTNNDAANLIQAQRFISRIRLEHQVRQLEAGSALDHLVDPTKLGSLHRRYLRAAFNVVRSSQQALAQRFLL